MKLIAGLVVMRLLIPRAAASMMFVVGPAMAVLPMILLSTKLPLIITAPGEMSFSGLIMLTSVMSAPHVVSRNSAHNP